MITRINDVAIAATSNEQGDILIPIRPICDALGVAYQPQHRRLQEDEFLSSVVTLRVTTGADGKKYEMVCLPLQYVFGWLFTINPANVSEEARPAVKRYRLECYDALYNHFARARQRQLDENREEIRLLDEISRAKDTLSESKASLRNLETKLAKLRAARLDEQPTLFD
ncbi:MAG: phage antirepressor N-terminal domain-containing protein [Muribaculaceae bacterium]|nr:phage antirepressor N-terminal domain-containing protein [Muribaculaceae bacterium]